MSSAKHALTPSTTHAITLLPRSHPNPTIWNSFVSRQKHFRLHSLKTAPEAFGSTYEQEVAFTDDEWEARLRNPLAFIFVAYNSLGEAETKTEDVATAGDWLGCAALLGPLSQKPGEFDKDPFAKGDDEPNGDNEHDVLVFEICALFVMPDARGMGFGKRLVDAAVAHAEMLGKEAKAREVVVKIAGAADNVSALRLYEAWGFTVVRHFKGERKDMVGLEKSVVVVEARR